MSFFPLFWSDSITPACNLHFNLQSCWQRAGSNIECDSPAVLVSYGWCNKLPGMWWLKRTGLYFLTILEARCLKILSPGWNRDVGKICTPSGGMLWRTSPFPASSSFCWLLAILGLKSQTLCFHDDVAFSSVYIKFSSNSLLLGHMRLHLGPTLLITANLLILESLI